MRALVGLLVAALIPLALWAHALMFRGRGEAGFERLRRTAVRGRSCLRSGPEQPLFRSRARGELPACLRAPWRKCAVRAAARRPAARPRSSLRRTVAADTGGLCGFGRLRTCRALCCLCRAVALCRDRTRAEGAGALYYRDLTDGTLHLYAPGAWLAGRVRIAPEGRM